MQKDVWKSWSYSSQEVQRLINEVPHRHALGRIILLIPGSDEAVLAKRPGLLGAWNVKGNQAETGAISGTPVLRNILGTYMGVPKTLFRT